MSNKSWFNVSKFFKRSLNIAQIYPPWSNIFFCFSNLDFTYIFKFYRPENYVQLVLSSNLIYSDLINTQLELKCNSLCAQTRVPINNQSKIFPIIRNDLRFIERNFSYSKTAITLLLLGPRYPDRPHSLLNVCLQTYRDNRVC